VAWRIAVVGTIDLDHITTRHGEACGLLGGSAVYAGLAAARFAPVLLHGSVGSDSAAQLRAALAGLNVDITGVSISRAPTRRWRAKHDLTTGQTSSEEIEGGDAAWSPVLTPKAIRAPILFLGSMTAQNQLEVLKQSQARLIGLDSMSAFIEADGRAVREAAAHSDVVFLTQQELVKLTGTEPDRWVGAAQSLIHHGRIRAVVIKNGHAGATLVTKRGTLAQPAEFVADVVDPTGAGDALAGGFLGSCALAQRDDCEYFAHALFDGMKSAAATIGRLGIGGLRESLSSPFR
jgi:sugar/nucleoside kinase (ribokinase family)